MDEVPLKLPLIVIEFPVRVVVLMLPAVRFPTEVIVPETVKFPPVIFTLEVSTDIFPLGAVKIFPLRVSASTRLNVEIYVLVIFANISF